MTTPLVQRLQDEAGRTIDISSDPNNVKTMPMYDPEQQRLFLEAAEALAGRAEPYCWAVGSYIFTNKDHADQAVRHSWKERDWHKGPLPLYTTPSRAGGGEVGESLTYEGIDLCELSAEIERVQAMKIVEAVYAIAEERTDGYWSGHANACEEIKFRLNTAWKQEAALRGAGARGGDTTGETK